MWLGEVPPAEPSPLDGWPIYRRYMGSCVSNRVVPVANSINESQQSLEGLKARGDKQVTRVTISKEICKEYDVVTIIGKGAFSKVLHVVKKETEKVYALKIINKESYTETCVKTEIDILRQLSHPSIIQLHYLHESRSHVYMIMNLAQGGDLFDWLLKHGRFSERQAVQMMSKIVHALQYLHYNRVVHRDVKLENILLCRRSYDSTLMLGDFGLAYQFPVEVEPVLRGPCGTLEYQSPEAISGHLYSYPVDVWAVGVIVYTLLTGRLPFDPDDKTRLSSLILSGTYNTTTQVLM